MNPKPNGRVVKTSADKYELTVQRAFHASAEDVWASITESERTAGWFGAWRGEGGPGHTIEVEMAFEDGAPWCDLRIDRCEPPHLLSVSMIDEAGDWNMDLKLSESGGATVLEFVQHLADPSLAESVGPGWEYYLDMLVASRDGQPLPDFADYYPAQAEYYRAEAQAGRRV